MFLIGGGGGGYSGGLLQLIAYKTEEIRLEKPKPPQKTYYIKL